MHMYICMITVPFQINPDYSCVIQGVNPVQYECPLGGNDSNKEVEPRATEPIPHWEGAQEAKTKNHHHIHILELWKKAKVQGHKLNPINSLKFTTVCQHDLLLNKCISGLQPIYPIFKMY
ncbi:hypothetical protein CHARACLAT_028976 [Characodon lateralis]|uniref:Uncharacterized protein n=1 Tax=Characodon lateralis TaxID=208331 RepID=A0ABU7DBM1_9TELE|nr:hypothetical protein [Characodon lateralis]